ncbi:MAG: hypothetical protein U1E76_02545 [Planctomycetota bacterium]
MKKLLVILGLGAGIALLVLATRARAACDGTDRPAAQAQSPAMLSRLPIVGRMFAQTSAPAPADDPQPAARPRRARKIAAMGATPAPAGQYGSAAAELPTTAAPRAGAAQGNGLAVIEATAEDVPGVAEQQNQPFAPSMSRGARAGALPRNATGGGGMGGDPSGRVAHSGMGGGGGRAIAGGGTRAANASPGVAPPAARGPSHAELLEQLDELRDEVQSLRDEVRVLRRRLNRIEGPGEVRVMSATPSDSSARFAGVAPRR